MGFFTSAGQLVFAATAWFFVYSVLKYIYRLTFHPLAKFPGPTLAALTYKYEFYWDGVCDGQYNAQISRMHEIYGPIVRINPNELHCNDPEFIDQIYAGGGKRRHKNPYFIDSFGPIAKMGGFATTDHDLHRSRRRALNGFFSKASIVKLESRVHQLVQQLCDVLLSRSGNGEPFDVSLGYSCFTTDVITSYCFGQEQGMLESNDFSKSLRPIIRAGSYSLPLGRQFPLLIALVQSLPDYMAKKMDPDLSKWIDHMNELARYVGKIKSAYENGLEKEIMDHRSIFIDILESDLPPSEKTIERLGAEAGTMINAGTETTAWTLTLITFYTLTRPEIHAKLVAELKTVVTDPLNLPKWSELEKLPYLSAVILEAIRLGYGVATRLARVAPDEALVYEGTFQPPNGKPEKVIKYIIPPGTAIGMTNTIIHANERIFPDSQSFIPERWLKEDGTRRKDLEPYLLSFSKGSRQCLGINLAYCEMYLAVPALLLRVFPKMQLFETTESDVQYHHDLFIPAQHPESQGVRVLMA